MNRQRAKFFIRKDRDRGESLADAWKEQGGEDLYVEEGWDGRETREEARTIRLDR